MPINNENYQVYEVNDNPHLQRYMSFEKFVSLLSRREMFLQESIVLKTRLKELVPLLSEKVR